MPRTKTIQVFQYAELNDKAKEKARDWYRGRDGGLDHEWWESTFDDAVTIAAAFGLDISTRMVKYHVCGSKGKPGRDGQRQETNIFFSGFWSQGDGACFEGEYAYRAGALAAVTDHAPKDEKLAAIVEELQAAQAAAGFRVKLSIKHADAHYYHERTMQMEVHDDCDRDPDGGAILPDSDWLTEEQVKPVREALIKFAKWIYKQLESEHEYLTSDEYVAETIEGNDYEFLEDGSRA